MLDTVERVTIKEVRSYIGQRYDTTAIFAKTGNDRNNLLVMKMIDIALYHMYSAVAPKNVSENRLLRYQDAIKWLSDLQKGKLVMNDEPLLTNTDANSAPNGTPVYGAQEKRDNFY